MRVFVAVLVLIFSFQSWTKADDISDFEIEGMSIGDSLLDYFSEEEIIKNIEKDVFEDTDRKFTSVGFYRQFGEFDGMQFVYKTNDNKYIINNIAGGIFYSDIKKCKKKLKLVSKEISRLFKGAKTNFDVKQIHPTDKSGKSYAVSDAFFLDTGSISIRCSDWSDEITKKYGWDDNLRLGIRSKEFNDWILDR